MKKIKHVIYYGGVSGKFSSDDRSGCDDVLSVAWSGNTALEWKTW